MVRLRLMLLLAVALAALAPALAAGQTAPEAELELRLPDPAWTPDRPAGPLTVLATPAALVDPLVPAGDAARTELLRAVRAAEFAGGVARILGQAPPGAPALRTWAVRLGEPADAAAVRTALRRALTARAGTAGLAAAGIPGVTGGVLLDRTAADGSRVMLAMFPAGAWLYGIDAVAAPGAAPPDGAVLTDLAGRLWTRQPERPGAGPAAHPLEVTDALAAELAAARGAARGRGAAVVPRAGSVQAAHHSGRDLAIGLFGVAAEPELFVRGPGGAWRWVGDVGGPGCPRIPAEVRAVWGLATTCPAQTSVVAQPRGRGLADDASPLHGIGMWVWEVPRSGGVSGIIARAKAHGLRTVYVKSGDGIHYWRQFDSSVKALRAAGLRVCAWQYIRGRRPVAEARVGARAVARGAECFVVNAEVEFERMGIGRTSKAQRVARSYMAELRRLVGHDTPVGMTSFAYPDYHPRFPYTAFLTGPNAADVNMPQIYWGAFRTRVDTSVRHAARWNALYGAPIAPIGGTYMGERAADLLRFRCLAAGYGWVGVSYWSLQHTRPRQWPWVSNRRACAAPAPAAREYPELRPGRRGDPVLLLQERLWAWGYPVTRDAVYGPQTRTAVRTFQRDRGLAQSGVATPTTWALLLGTPPPA